MYIAVVVYLPKSKADKRKSLLGNPDDSSDDEKVFEVFVMFSLSDSSVPELVMHVLKSFTENFNTKSN